MKKKFLTILACCGLILIASLGLVACDALETPPGGPETTTEYITKADLETYIEEKGTMHFNKGYKGNEQFGSGDNARSGRIEVAKKGESIDVKLFGTNYGTDSVLCIKDGEGFQTTERGLEKMDDVSGAIAFYSQFFSDSFQPLQAFVAPDTTQVTKVTAGNKITFSYVDQIAEGPLPEEFEKHDLNIKLTFVDDALVKYEATSADPINFVYNVVYEEFSGPVNFSDVDLDNYVKAFTLGKVSV